MNQATNARTNHEKLSQFVAGEHASMKQRIDNMIPSSLQKGFSEKQSTIEIKDTEIGQKITNNTISTFNISKAQGKNDKEAKSINN